MHENTHIQINAHYQPRNTKHIISYACFSMLSLERVITEDLTSIKSMAHDLTLSPIPFSSPKFHLPLKTSIGLPLKCYLMHGISMANDSFGGFYFTGKHHGGKMSYPIISCNSSDPDQIPPEAVFSEAEGIHRTYFLV